MIIKYKNGDIWTAISKQTGWPVTNIEIGTFTLGGVKYHRPRSLQRALGKQEIGEKVKPFSFLLRAQSKVKVPSKKVIDDTIDTIDKTVSKIRERAAKAGMTVSQWKDAFNNFKPPTKNQKYIVTGDAVSFVSNGKTYSTSKQNPLYGEIVKGLKDGKDTTELVKLVDIANAIEISSDGVIKNEGGVLKYNKAEIEETVAQWLMSNLHRGKNAVQPVVNFMALANKNPSPGSIDSLWRFIRKNGLVLTPSGKFICYKYVKDDFYDYKTGKHFNGLGCKLSMPRDGVVHDINNACGAGYHAATFAFVQNYSTIIEVVISPEMVVSCPKNEEDKLRVCEYDVHKILKHKSVEISERTVQEDFFKFSA